MSATETPPSLPAERPYRAIETIGFCGGLAAALVVIAFMLDDGEARLITLSLMCLGGAVGYALGIFLSPFTQSEETEFAKVGKLVSAVVTGFVLAKLGPALDSVVSSQVLFVPTNLFRLTSFVGCMLLTAITVFVHRKYVFGS